MNPKTLEAELRLDWNRVKSRVDYYDLDKTEVLFKQKRNQISRNNFISTHNGKVKNKYHNMIEQRLIVDKVNGCDIVIVSIYCLDCKKTISEKVVAYNHKLMDSYEKVLIGVDKQPHT